MLHMQLNSGARCEGGIGGADRDRTDDLLHAMQALSQLSYSPPFSKTGREDSGKSGQTINPHDRQFKGNLAASAFESSSLWE